MLAVRQNWWSRLAGIAALLLSPAWLQAAEREPVETVDMFAAAKAGQIEIKYIPKDAHAGNLFVTNKTKRPLTVRLPEAFGARPVLAQLGQQGGGFGAGGGGGGGNQGQVGGGGGGGGGNAFGGGALNIAPEKVGKAKLMCLCADHGKPDPNPRVPYEIMPIEQFSDDPKVQEFAKLFGRGGLDPQAAQAVAWHLCSGMSWQELAAKKIDRLAYGEESYFSRQQLQAAVAISKEAERLAAKRTEGGSSTSASLSNR